MRDHINRRVAALVAGLSLAAPATAAAQPLAIYNNAGAPQSVINQMQEAAADEINNHVDPAYPKAVSISWDNGATPASTDWPVVLVSVDQWSSPCGDCWGYHGEWQTPAAYVRWDNTDLSSSEYVFSHEVVEMAADPVPGTDPEICDPVAWEQATLDGVTIAVFQLPDGSTWPQWPPPSVPPDTTPLTVTSVSGATPTTTTTTTTTTQTTTQTTTKTITATTKRKRRPARRHRRSHRRPSASKSTRRHEPGEGPRQGAGIQATRRWTPELRALQPALPRPVRREPQRPARLTSSGEI